MLNLSCLASLSLLHKFSQHHYTFLLILLYKLYDMLLIFRYRASGGTTNYSSLIINYCKLQICRLDRVFAESLKSMLDRICTSRNVIISAIHCNRPDRQLDSLIALNCLSLIRRLPIGNCTISHDKSTSTLELHNLPSPVFIYSHAVIR